MRIAFIGINRHLRPRVESMSNHLGPDEVIILNRLATVARVLAGTAHDVNNALQIIGGSAEMLEAGDDLSDPGRRALQRIRNQAARAAALVEDLMLFARDRGEPSSRVSLKEIVSKALALRAFMIRRAGLVLDYDAARSPSAEITGRAAPLQQVVLNVIMNAEQAVGGRTGGTISLRLREESGEAVLRIIDNGPGLSETVRDLAFEPLVTTRPAPESCGLGLAAARLIARAHGGDLSFEPRDDGACASLRLPLAAPSRTFPGPASTPTT